MCILRELENAFSGGGHADVSTVPLDDQRALLPRQRTGHVLDPYRIVSHLDGWAGQVGSHSILVILCAMYSTVV